jgi:uncharacterized repeat protein (TIGR03803 family)
MRAIWRRAAIGTTALALIFLLGLLVAPGANAWTFIVLHTFTSTSSDGAVPVAGVIMDKFGNLYGTTREGGTGTFPNSGTVFKLDPSGNESVLHSFHGAPDGAQPFAGLIMDTAGNLYGTTLSGGTGTILDCGDGCGTVFKLDLSGTETVLYSFKGSPDGSNPNAGLIMDAAGNLYGTTSTGGGACSPSGCGTVFKLDPSGTESVLYSFQDSPDGALPFAGLIMDAAGNLYGTTDSGGDQCSVLNFGCGTVFKLDASGSESLLYSFQGPFDGAGPYAGLIMDTASNLYGTTVAGGSGGGGTVFKLAPSGNESVHHSFSWAPDGALPFAGLIMDAAGNLYGTAAEGGSSAGNCCGTVFKLAPVTFADLTNLVKQCVTDLGAQNVLVTESNMAEAAFKKGNQKAVNRMLSTFIHQVVAVHSRKSLTSSQAAALVQDAKDLMS